MFLLAGLALTVMTSVIAELSFAIALTIAAACFFDGYVARFIGHAIERSMPVLVLHPIQANLAAPFFTIVDMFKLLGPREELFKEVQREVGRRRQASTGLTSASR